MSDELRDSRGQTKVGGKHHVHQERSVHMLADVRRCEAACFAGRASGAVGLSPGVALPKQSKSVAPNKNCSVSNVIQHSFQKSKLFVSDTCQWLLSDWWFYTLL